MQRSVRVPVLAAPAASLVAIATATAAGVPQPMDAASSRQCTATSAGTWPAVDEFHPAVREDAAYGDECASRYTVYRSADVCVPTEKLPVVPAVRERNARAGHDEFRRCLRDGEIDSTIREEAVTVLTQWLDVILTGEYSARDLFIAPECGLCATRGWDVASTNFSAGAGR